jgi:hypothetical protein
MPPKKSQDATEMDFQGCYGERIAPSQLVTFLEDVFDINSDPTLTNPNERFATCVWGHAGCVLADTEIEVRKVGEGEKHIIVVSPSPARPQT